MAKRMPEGWQPPYPGWSASFDKDVTEVVMAYYGIQSRTPGSRDFQERIRAAFQSEDGPVTVDQGRFTDSEGFANEVFVACWAQPARFEAWQARSPFTAWWNDPARTQEEAGYWREILRVPVKRFETLLSQTAEYEGVARLAPRLEGPIREHAYWGGMRDRLPVSQEDPRLDSPLGETLTERPARQTRGQRLRVTAPHNLALIRSDQDWSRCGGKELETYRELIQPVLSRGMEFLQQHPLETGCCESRLVEQTDAQGAPQSKTFGMAYFLTLGHLERWAEHHPTHLAIFGKFFEMVKKHDFKLDLRLHHEVSVLPAGGQTFEYINCHPKTGVLPYFESQTF